MTAVRRPGVPGRRRNTPRHDARAFADLLRPATKAAVPAHPVSQDNFTPLGGGWAMLGNDVAGDCVSVTWANIRRLMTHLAGAERYPSQDEVWALYKTQNPHFDPNGDPNVNGPGSPADGGMDIQELLDHLVKEGGPDGVKALGWAKVDLTDLDEVKAAISIFGYLWTGIVVQEAQMEQFNDEQAWDWVSGSPEDGGHSVISGGYTGQPSGDVEFETWMQETAFTDNYWRHGVEEGYIVIWPEHTGTAEFQEGIDLSVVAADYTALTGDPFPAPVPSPQPSPTPTPVPPGPTPEPADGLAADLALVNAVRHFVNERHHLSHEDRHVAAALDTWIAARGFTTS